MCLPDAAAGGADKPRLNIRERGVIPPRIGVHSGAVPAPGISNTLD